MTSKKTDDTKQVNTTAHKAIHLDPSHNWITASWRLFSIYPYSSEDLPIIDSKDIYWLTIDKCMCKECKFKNWIGVKYIHMSSFIDDIKSTDYDFWIYDRGFEILVKCKYSDNTKTTITYTDIYWECEVLNRGDNIRLVKRYPITHLFGNKEIILQVLHSNSKN